MRTPGPEVEIATSEQETQSGGNACLRRPLALYQEKGRGTLGRQSIQCPRQAAPHLSCVKKAFPLRLSKSIMIIMPRGCSSYFRKTVFK